MRNTRQRQGRDFPDPGENNYLKNAELDEEGNYNSIDGILGNSVSKRDTAEQQHRSLLDQLEATRRLAELAEKPVDGYEPPER